VTANIEMLSQAPGAICAAVGQTSDPSSLSFSDSLVAASETSSTAGAANDAGPKADPQQRSTFDDAKTSTADPDLRAVQPPILPQQVALPQQLLPAEQTRLTSFIFTPTQISLGDPASTSEGATVVSDQPMPKGAAPTLAGTESTIANPGVIESDIIQSTYALPGAVPAQTASILSGAKTQEIKAPIVPSSKTGNDDSSAVVPGATKSVRKPVQNAEPSTSPNELQDSLLASFVYAQPSAVPNVPSDPNLNTIQSVVPTALHDAVQTSFSTTVLNGPSSAFPNGFSAAVLNAIQNSVPSLAQNEVQNPLPKEFLDTQSSAAPSIPSRAMPNSIQSGAPNTASNGVRDTLPNAVLSAPSSSAPSVPLNEVSNAVQSTTPTIPNEVQNPLSKAVLSAPSSFAPSIPFNSMSNAVQSAAPNTAPNEVQNPLAKPVPSAPSSTLSSVPSNVALNALQNAAPNTAPNEVQNPLPKAVLSAPSSSAPSVPLNSMSNAVQSAAPNTAPNEVQNPLPKAVLSAPSSSAPSVPLNSMSNAVQSAAPNTAPNEVQNPLPKPVPSAPSSTVSSVPSNAAPNAAPSEVQNPLAKPVPSDPPSAVSHVLLNTTPNLLPVPHAASNASAKGDIVSTDHAAPSAAAPDQSVFATGLSTPGSTANQFVALTQLISGLMGTVRTGVSPLNPATAANASVANGGIDKGGIKDTSSNFAGLKQHPQSASDLAGSQTDSQAASSSGDQSQSSSSSQGQNAAPAPMIFANHSVAAMADTQSRANSSPVQIVPTVAGVAGHVATAPNNTAHISTAVPQALPAINTAKLIQTMGQSEMRVGMRTNEFGNISIRTSATRDLISAQISLDHGELASTLAAHLPEMQARLGGNQAVDVRIDMNREGSSQGAGMFGGMSNGSADQSRGGRQQAGNPASSYSTNSVAERHSSTSAAAMASENGRPNARLDIRV
jgi:hypothetical protein